MTADALLAGPLGRSLCVQLLDDRLAPPGKRASRAWLGALDAARSGDAKRCARKLSKCTAIADLSVIPFDGSALMAGLVAAVDFAMPWCEPDPEDLGFAVDAAREALRPVAEAVAVAATGVPDVRWWTEPVNGSQRYAQFLDQNAVPKPQLTGAATLVRAWLDETDDDERSAHDQPEDPDSSPTGRWWSSPQRSGLPVTTRGLASLGAVGLALREAGPWGLPARCWPVAPQDGARVYEVYGPGQWAELVERYPLDVSKSRSHAWQRTTGRLGRWLIPDYATVAADWDAIHVSVAGYLTAAGIAVRSACGACTMLAGWDPDATWWLNDVLSFTGPPEDWREDDRAPFRWAQTA